MDKRALLATAICMGIFLLWIFLSPKLFSHRQAPPSQPKPPASQPVKPVTPAPAEAPHPVPPAPEAARPKVDAAPPVPFETKFLKGEFTNVGAGLRSLVLKYPDEKHAVPLLLPCDPGYPHLALRIVRRADAPEPEKIESTPWKIEQHDANGLCEFSTTLRNGTTIRKKLQLDPDRYTFRVTISLTPPKTEEGRAPGEQPLQLELLAFNGLFHENRYRYEQYLKGEVLVGGKVQHLSLGDVAKGEEKINEFKKMPEGPDRNEKWKEAWKHLQVTDPARRWVGLRNRFFAVLLLPSDANTEGKVQSYAFRAAPPEELKSQAHSPEAARALENSPEAIKIHETLKNLDVEVFTIPFKLSEKSGSEILDFQAYAGPIQKDALAQFPDAQEIASYGSSCIFPAQIINLVGSVILAILKFFAGVFHNWGVAIIATTIFIRFFVFPLSLKSQKSAYQMQQLAPKIKILQERYKDDREKLSVEQMRLMREHKINPAGGCLPLLLQLPIFIGMFSVFDSSIELRGQPFFGWIHDLSRPDRLLDLHRTIDLPIIPAFDSFNLLPIVMLIVWFLQAYFAPRSPDPQMQQQQKMMMAMPIIFGLMCYNYAAGLSLYFLVNSGLAMIEQKIIKKYILKIPPKGGPAPAATVAPV